MPVCDRMNSCKLLMHNRTIDTGFILCAQKRTRTYTEKYTKRAQLINLPQQAIFPS